MEGISATESGCKLHRCLTRFDLWYINVTTPSFYTISVKLNHNVNVKSWVIAKNIFCKLTGTLTFYYEMLISSLLNLSECLCQIIYQQISLKALLIYCFHIRIRCRMVSELDLRCRGLKSNSCKNALCPDQAPCKHVKAEAILQKITWRRWPHVNVCSLLLKKIYIYIFL